MTNQTGPELPKQFATFREFFKLESTGGLLLFVAAVLAMLLKNSLRVAEREPPLLSICAKYLHLRLP